MLPYCPSSSFDCNRATSLAVSRNCWNSSRPSYRHCSSVVVAQATRLSAPISRAAVSEAGGVSRALSETVTSCEARKVLSVSSYHNSNRPLSLYSGHGSPTISSRRRLFRLLYLSRSCPLTTISSLEWSPQSMVYTSFRMTPLRTHPSSSLPRKPGGSGCSVTCWLSGS